ncbi:MAG: hypothetical protein KL863_05660 [Rhizobium sp.]|nr:hypothetical protein [Rhizobium sp.]
MAKLSYRAATEQKRVSLIQEAFRNVAKAKVWKDWGSGVVGGQGLQNTRIRSGRTPESNNS